MRDEGVKFRKSVDVGNPEIITDALVSSGIHHYKRMGPDGGFPGGIQLYAHLSDRECREWPQKPKNAQRNPAGIRSFLKEGAMGA